MVFVKQCINVIGLFIDKLNVLETILYGKLMTSENCGKNQVHFDSLQKTNELSRKQVPPWKAQANICGSTSE